MQSAIRRRGGTPSHIEKVNWLKMRMFEIRDPDGHILWFGQSYHRDSPVRPRGMLRSVMPELPVDDVQAGVSHYTDVLGFKVNYQQSDIAVIDRDDVRLLLVARSPRHTGVGSAYFYVRDVDALYWSSSARVPTCRLSQRASRGGFVSSVFWIRKGTA